MSTQPPHDANPNEDPAGLPGNAADLMGLGLPTQGDLSTIGPAAAGDHAPTQDASRGTGSPTGGAFVPPTVEQLNGLFPQLEILELLGAGGMGAVYKARQTALDRIVAVKILPPQVGRSPGFAERFTREARALARLNHPNIVAVHDFGRVNVGPALPANNAPAASGTSANAQRPAQPALPEAQPALRGDLFYIVMEFIDGANLRQTIRAGTLKPHDALAIVSQVCEALQFAHDEGIVHRDIKPENILIDKKGRVRIADFGLAKLAAIEGEADPMTLTHANAYMGTPKYMAPEQIEGAHEVDHRADIFSLGVVFYELLTGELPLGRFAPPSQKVQVDVRLDEVVLRTLEKEPIRRYQQASEMRTQVEQLRGMSPAAIQRAVGAEYKSKATFLGLPLLHVAFGIDPRTGRKRVAKGIIAIGDVAKGVFAFGGLAMGVFAVGGLAMGLVTIGGLSLGLLAAAGGLAVGGFAFGGLALGGVAIGGCALGVYAYGGWAAGGVVVSGAVREPPAVRFFEPWVKDWAAWLTVLCIVVPLLGLVVGIFSWLVLRANGDLGIDPPSTGPQRAGPSPAPSPAASSKPLMQMGLREAARELFVPEHLDKPEVSPTRRWVYVATIFASVIAAQILGAGLKLSIVVALIMFIPMVLIMAMVAVKHHGSRAARQAKFALSMFAVAFVGIPVILFMSNPQSGLDRIYRLTGATPGADDARIIQTMFLFLVFGTLLSLIGYWLKLRNARWHKAWMTGAAVAMLAAIVVAAIAFAANRNTPITYSYFGDTGFIATPDGPQLSDAKARELGISPAQRKEADRIFQDYYGQYVKLERQHTTHTRDADGRVRIVIDPFPDEMHALIERLTKELGGVVDSRVAPPLPEKGKVHTQIGLFRTAGEAKVKATLWREDRGSAEDSHFFQQEIEWLDGGHQTSASRGKDVFAFPEHFRLYWTDSVPAVPADKQGTPLPKAPMSQTLTPTIKLEPEVRVPTAAEKIALPRHIRMWRTVRT